MRERLGDGDDPGAAVDRLPVAPVGAGARAKRHGLAVARHELSGGVDPDAAGDHVAGGRAPADDERLIERAGGGSDRRSPG